jgi:dephospho-CoA kinase
MQRDSISAEEVMKRMEYQMQDRIKMRLCDFVIHNDEHELLIPQVLGIHENLMTLAKGSSLRT